MKTFLKIFGFIIIFFLYLHFTNWWTDLPGMEAFKSQKDRMGCVEGVHDLTSSGNGKEKLVVSNINTHTVEYPLNNEEVMVEYCLTIENHTSDLNSTGILISFLDKDKSVLAETTDFVSDIPGRRSKTVYGSTFISTQLAKQMTSVIVSDK